MRTCTLKAMLKAVLALGGLSYGRSVTADQREQLITLAGEGIRETWEVFPWWELERLEERHYRPRYDGAVAYAAGDIVWTENADGVETYYEAAGPAGTFALFTDGASNITMGIRNFTGTLAAGAALPEVGSVVRDGDTTTATLTAVVDNLDGTISISFVQNAAFTGSTVYHVAGDDDDPSVNTEQWTAGPGFDAFVLLDPATAEEGLTWITETGGVISDALGSVTDVWDRDPRKPGTGAVRLRDSYRLRNDRVQMKPGRAVVPSVWVQYQVPAPALDSTAWSAAEAVAVRTVRYYHGDGVSAGHGECYEAIAAVAEDEDAPPGNAHWRAVVFPEVLQTLMVAKTRAHALRADGQEDKAAGEEGRWSLLLERAIVRETTQVHQGGRWGGK